MDGSKNRLYDDHLGVNKMGKNIRKSPLHQPNFPANSNANRQQQQPQPHVYNISKNDFRNLVQQLTGSPSREPLPRPPPNPPKPQSTRLQKIRPPPLAPLNRPHVPPVVPAQAPAQAPPPAQAPAPAPAVSLAPAPAPLPPPVPYNNGFVRHPPRYGQPVPQFGQVQALAPRDPVWTLAAESPISAYMRDLQHAMADPGLMGNQPQPFPPVHAQRPQVPGQIQPPYRCLLPNPPMSGFPSPRVNGPPPMWPNLPSPQMNGPAFLPSPNSQFLLPSTPSYMNNFLSPRSPYPPLSPGIQFPPPLTPNFVFSPISQSGILGPGPQPPPSPGLYFPLSPSGLFLSPRWRDH